MSSANFREPTNDELWAQPPVMPQAPPTSQELATIARFDPRGFWTGPEK